ncbi:hypothetical protein [Thalassovita taeanensis]|uniref:hypothetical protein n=1 Tax=Thalassovita taeanensis TaxID=657014 RepID=UPI001FE64960|nr:hypothetical protein [Thalassovita taeanensis]
MEKVVLVTGGARGIDRAIVENLAADHDVAFTSLGINPTALLDAAHPDLLNLHATQT